MDIVKKEIEKALKSSKIEKYSNIRYEIKSNTPEDKESLKKMIVQGSSIQYATIIEIDFIKALEKPSRKAKRLKKLFPSNNNEVFNYREDGPNIRIYNSPIYLYGEYIKLSRNMCQTPLKIGHDFKTERSVSDFCHEFKKYFDSGPVKFMASGREDIDVRCLEGRPFILEVQYPTKNLNLQNLSINLYPEINIINLSLVKKEAKDIVNCETPTKLYNLLIYSQFQIFFEKKYDLDQKTPLRVLHRRENLIRKKEIEVLNVEELEDNGFYYDVDIRASSGTYIKEWVNGDFNRTIPNLNADLLELDIIKVEQKLDENYILKHINYSRII